MGSGEADSFIIGEAQQLRKAGCPHVSLKPPCPVPCFQAPPHAWASTAGRLPLFCLFNSRRVAVEDRMIHFFLGTHTIFSTLKISTATVPGLHSACDLLAIKILILLDSNLPIKINILLCGSCGHRLQVLVATSDNDIRDSCWTNEIFPITSSSLLREMRRVSLPSFLSSLKAKYASS